MANLLIKIKTLTVKECLKGMGEKKCLGSFSRRSFLQSEIRFFCLVDTNKTNEGRAE